jgi:hypothetical protein
VGRLRQCLVCRKREAKECLRRFVMQAGGLVWDHGQRLPGRGVYVHAADGGGLLCDGKAARPAVCRPGVWERALRLKPGSLSVEDIKSALLADRG